MKNIRTLATSNASAVSTPVVLRETKTTRLIFKPLIIDNVHDQEASVRGSFVFQKKGRNSQWEDYQESTLSQLKSGEGVKLELKSSEILRLYNHLTTIYQLYEQQGISSGNHIILNANEGLGALLDASENELVNLFDVQGDNATELFLRLIRLLPKLKETPSAISILEQLDLGDLDELRGAVGLSILKSILKEWENNRGNSNEEFWQRLLDKYSFVLSQIFPYPLVIVKGKAYVGGKSVLNEGGNIVDFLAKNEISKNAVLIEIKTPATALLGSKYRNNVFNMSSELVGAIVQIANYKNSLSSEFSSLSRGNPTDWESFNPSCVIICGSIEDELDSQEKKKSFELFRSNLRDIEIVTYDELFGKVEFLIKFLEGEKSHDDDESDEIPF